MTDKLKPCPFCGGEAKWFNTESKVYCVKCCCSTAAFIDKRDATKSWNTRKPMDRIVEQLEEEIKQLPRIQHWPDWKKCYTKAIEIVKGVQNE